MKDAEITKLRRLDLLGSNKLIKKMFKRKIDSQGKSIFKDSKNE